MKTTRSHPGRPGWIIVAALALLASVPFLLPRQTRPSPADEHAPGLSNNGNTQAARTPVVRGHHATPDADEATATPKPTKTRDRSPQASPASAAPPALAALSNSSPAAATRPGAGAPSVTRQPRHSRDDGPLAQQDHEAPHSADAVAASPGSPLTGRAARTTTAADPAATTSLATATQPSVSEPAIVRTPAIPLSHMIDDTVEAEVAAELAPDVPLGTLEAIRQTFEQEAGVNELSPDDPVYAERWAQAEPAAAERIRALYGWGAFQAFQRKLVFEQLEARKAAGEK